MWRMGEECGVLYTEDRQLLRQLLALEKLPTRSEADAATYTNARGKVFAWQVTFRLSLWNRVIRAIGKEAVEIRPEPRPGTRREAVSSGATAPAPSRAARRQAPATGEKPSKAAPAAARPAAAGTSRPTASAADRRGAAPKPAPTPTTSLAGATRKSGPAPVAETRPQESARAARKTPERTGDGDRVAPTPPAASIHAPGRAAPPRNVSKTASKPKSSSEREAGEDTRSAPRSTARPATPERAARPGAPSTSAGHQAPTAKPDPLPAPRGGRRAAEQRPPAAQKVTAEPQGKTTRPRVPPTSQEATTAAPARTAAPTPAPTRGRGDRRAAAAGPASSPTPATPEPARRPRGKPPAPVSPAVTAAPLPPTKRPRSQTSDSPQTSTAQAASAAGRRRP
jgi:hypothetical protein